MARIRVVKARQTNKKNQPKITFFHNDNYNKALNKISSKKSKGKSVKLIALNDRQEDKYIRNKNKKNIRFHDSSYM